MLVLRRLAVILGFAGNDVITGGEANDYLSGGAGDDNLTGNGGNDSIWRKDRRHCRSVPPLPSNSATGERGFAINTVSLEGARAQEVRNVAEMQAEARVKQEIEGLADPETQPAELAARQERMEKIIEKIKADKSTADPEKRAAMEKAIMDLQSQIPSAEIAQRREFEKALVEKTASLAMAKRTPLKARRWRRYASWAFPMTHDRL